MGLTGQTAREHQSQHQGHDAAGVGARFECECPALHLQSRDFIHRVLVDIAAHGPGMRYAHGVKIELIQVFPVLKVSLFLIVAFIAILKKKPLTCFTDDFLVFPIKQ